jgi:hypothetical protein
MADLGGQAGDLALDIEDGIDAFDRLELAPVSTGHLGTTMEAWAYA